MKDRIFQQSLKRGIVPLSIKVTAYAGGRYFFNGIDLRYERLLALFAKCGYERLLDWGEIYTVDDVAVDLTDFEPTAYHIDARKRVANLGVTITPYQPAMLDKMRIFVEKLAYWHWFPAGWEDGFGESGHALVALKDERIVGKNYSKRIHVEDSNGKRNAS